MIFPATASIGLSIYANYEVLKKNLVPVLGGCLAGAATAVFSVLGLCKLFGLDEKMTASLLPKSVTTAIAVPICEQNGGIAQITIVALMIAGMLGAVLAPSLWPVVPHRGQRGRDRPCHRLFQPCGPAPPPRSRWARRSAR